MYYSITKRISYFLIVIGVLLIIFGLWQYMPKTFSSETPDHVFMSLIAKRVVFPILGFILFIMGYTFLKFVSEVKKETQRLSVEVNRLTKVIENMQGK